MFRDIPPALEILHQATGRFDKRFAIGPANWPHFDLLWIHEGAVTLAIGAADAPLTLEAPMGVLIFPNVPFRGAALGAFARASVCHFSGDFSDSNSTGVLGLETGPRDYIRPHPSNTYHIQNMLRLSLEYADRGADPGVRIRLLGAILECLTQAPDGPEAAGRVTQAWDYAATRLGEMRSLVDVAAGIGLSESTFRAQHRAHFPTSAGQHLQQIRLRRAEQLLATTGLSLAEISEAVGYAHAESLSAAFKRARGQSPGAYRRWCKRFA